MRLCQKLPTKWCSFYIHKKQLFFNSVLGVFNDSSQHEILNLIWFLYSVFPLGQWASLQGSLIYLLCSWRSKGSHWFLNLTMDICCALIVISIQFSSLGTSKRCCLCPESWLGDKHIIFIRIVGLIIGLWESRSKTAPGAATVGSGY